MYSMLIDTPLFVAKYNQKKFFLKFKNYMRGIVLDLGCGKKPYKGHIFGNYFGVDRMDYRPEICGDINRLPIRTVSVNSIICSEVLEHVPSPKESFKEMARVLKEGGILYLTTPFYWYQHYAPQDYWRLTQYSLMLLLNQNNFTIKYFNRYGGLNYFIANRISEWVFSILMKTHITEKTALMLLAPIQLLLLAYSKLDRFNKKDAAGWVVLAQKNKTQNDK